MGKYFIAHITIGIQTVSAQNRSCVLPDSCHDIRWSVVMRPPVCSLVMSALVSGMVRRGHMSDTEVAEIEDMLNTSHMEDMEHLDILRPPHSHMSHRHEAAVHVSTFGSCKFIQRGYC